VIDTLQGAQVEKAEIFFHFAPEIRLTPGPAENCWSAVRSGSSRKLLVYTDPGWEYECLYGSTDPILGWYSQALEEKTPSVTLRGMLRNPAQGTSRTRIVTSGG
jgi:hypothetical protein